MVASPLLTPDMETEFPLLLPLIFATSELLDFHVPKPNSECSVMVSPLLIVTSLYTFLAAIIAYIEK